MLQTLKRRVKLAGTLSKRTVSKLLPAGFAIARIVPSAGMKNTAR
jgi:primosomal replication protein N